MEWMALGVAVEVVAVEVVVVEVAELLDCHENLFNEGNGFRTSRAVSGASRHGD